MEPRLGPLFMRITLFRFVALLLIPCLIADPLTAGSLVRLSNPTSPLVISQAVYADSFAEEAITAYLLDFWHVFFPKERIDQIEREAAAVPLAHPGTYGPGKAALAALYDQHSEKKAEFQEVRSDNLFDKKLSLFQREKEWIEVEFAPGHEADQFTNPLRAVWFALSHDNDGVLQALKRVISALKISSLAGVAAVVGGERVSLKAFPIQQEFLQLIFSEERSKQFQTPLRGLLREVERPA